MSDPVHSNDFSGQDGEVSLERGTDGDSPIEINSTTPVKAEPTWIITSDLFELYEEDKEILASSRWLNDRIIEAAQKILEQQCGDTIKGWQCPLYEQSPSKFKAIKDGEEFAQIILVGKSHWIAVSNGCKTGVLDVYHSMYNNISLQTQKQICTFWRPPTKMATFQLVNIQRQPNASDCGLFAIACATEIAHRKKPLLLYWDVSEMRGHLAKCLEAVKLTCFPQARTRRIPVGNHYKKVLHEELFCICRIPSDRRMPMICCDNCAMWFHKACMGLEMK